MESTGLKEDREVSTPKHRRGSPARGRTASIDSVVLYKFTSDESSSISPLLGDAPISKCQQDGAGSALAGVFHASVDGSSHPTSCLNGDDSAACVDSGGCYNDLTVSIKTDNEKASKANDDLLNRASALTKVSGIERTAKRRNISTQLLLEGSSVSEPVKIRKKRAVKKAPKSVDTSTSVPSKLMSPTENTIPFWVSSPKEVKDIESYHKTLFSRLSQIEKQMKRFEAERQGLLNALYQFNMPPLHASGSASISATVKKSTDAMDQSSEISDVNASTINTMEAPATSGNVDTESSHSILPGSTGLQKECTGVFISIPVETNGSTDELVCDASAAVPDVRGGAHIDKKEMRSAGSSAPRNIEPTSMDCDAQNDAFASDSNIAVSVGPSQPLHGAQDEVGNGAHSIAEDYSQKMLDSINKLNDMLDNDLELYTGSQLDCNAADYNAGNFMESSTKHEFRMWHSCWLRQPCKGHRPSSAPPFERTPVNSRCIRPAVQVSPLKDVSPGQVSNEAPRDILEEFWKLDFTGLSKHQLTMLAHFFGLKSSLTTQSHIEEMEKIRSYLVDFVVK